MAKIVRFHRLGGPEVLKIEEVPLRKPSKGEVSLSVQAIGLNGSYPNSAISVRPVAATERNNGRSPR